MFQDMMMSNCHTLWGKKLIPREPKITQQDLEIQSLEYRWKNAGPRHDLFLCCPLVVKKGLASCSPEVLL